MAYYTCTIAHDDDNRQIIIHWDDHDPNRHLVTPVSVPASELDEARLVHEVGRMGFRIISTDSDNVGRGWAIVSRSFTRESTAQHYFYNPLTNGWQTYLSETDKNMIRTKYPDARVPGVNGGGKRS